MIRYTLMSRLGLAEPLVRLARTIENSIGLRHLGPPSLHDRAFVLTGARANAPPDLSYAGPSVRATVPDWISRFWPFTLTSTFAAAPMEAAKADCPIRSGGNALSDLTAASMSSISRPIG